MKQENKQFSNANFIGNIRRLPAPSRAALLRELWETAGQAPSDSIQATIATE